MDARYLRVKNWGKFQHYKDKEPGWIKLYAAAIRKNQFLELDELVQWQLVRVWIIASQATRFTRDEEGRKVPVLTDDERMLRRAICTLKRIPLERFVRDGWLIPVDENDLINDLSSSPALDEDYTPTSPLLVVENLREVELQEPKTPAELSTSRDIKRVYDHWRQVRGKTDARYGKISDQRRQKIKTRLAEFTADDLVRALDNVARDPWPERARHDDITVLFKSRESVDRWLEMTGKETGVDDDLEAYNRY